MVKKWFMREDLPRTSLIKRERKWEKNKWKWVKSQLKKKRLWCWEINLKDEVMLGHKNELKGRWQNKKKKFLSCEIKLKMKLCWIFR